MRTGEFGDDVLAERVKDLNRKGMVKGTFNGDKEFDRGRVEVFFDRSQDAIKFNDKVSMSFTRKILFKDGSTKLSPLLLIFDL